MWRIAIKMNAKLLLKHASKTHILHISRNVEKMWRMDLKMNVKMDSKSARQPSSQPDPRMPQEPRPSPQREGGSTQEGKRHQDHNQRLVFTMVLTRVSQPGSQAASKPASQGSSL